MQSDEVQFVHFNDVCLEYALDLTATVSVSHPLSGPTYQVPQPAARICSLKPKRPNPNPLQRRCVLALA
ncbi:uncharacterized protein DSM5745_10857 [Aspergillus mulundensis]|uniref:Uncharacterized protein n=1 Tax=Aspergillus mulundensis TaxID=1810919 RepID=A0A3D8QEZ0_9EURO|nr:hypothetical protein DSM5745_10857 [Aspergillus mulundensis]RDW60399.1 hypothetical protein DSM5745_10857 [Aspergillus mulundensis]